jgi:hypothetical protein
MAMVILFGGGDAGGLFITSSGVRPIPPFDPSTLRELRGISSLVAAVNSRAADDDARELAQLVNRAANLAVARVEAVVGPLDEGVGIVFIDDDGGFFCGTTGRPPLPVPWPPRSAPNLEDLIAAGALDEQVLRLVETATARGTNVVTMLEDPLTTARELGVELSQRAARDLQAVAPSRLSELRDPVDTEVVQYFHKVLEDGRYLATWASRPYEVSRAIDVTLSEAAIDRVLAVAGSSSRLGPGAVENPIAIAVVVGIVIMLVDRPAELEHLAVQDRSGREKL